MSSPGNLSRLQGREGWRKKIEKKNSSSKAKIIVSISYEQRITKETPISLEPLNALDSTTDYSGLVWGG